VTFACSLSPFPRLTWTHAGDPRGRNGIPAPFLSFWNIESLRDTLLTTERLKQHFGGVKIEARYLLDRNDDVLKAEGDFFRRQKLDGVVDFIGLLNYYPKLTLIENLKFRAEESIRTIAGSSQR